MHMGNWILGDMEEAVHLVMGAINGLKYCCGEMGGISFAPLPHFILTKVSIWSLLINAHSQDFLQFSLLIISILTVLLPNPSRWLPSL